jgi:RNA polymerase sigma-32 factor
MTSFDDAQTRRSDIAFVRKAMTIPTLTREHEFELARRWREHGDPAAMHEIVSAYTRLVIAIAARFRFYGLPAGDLVQEGNLGLMLAVARFEPEREVRFSTYATWWIRSQIQDYILRNWSIVRTGTTTAQKSLFFNLRQLRARIADSDRGARLSVEGRAKIARMLGVSESDVADMEGRLSGQDRSLNVPIGEEGDDEWLDLLVDERPNPEDSAAALDDRRVRHKSLFEALNELPLRERRIIAERRLRDEAATLETLGRELGVSKERVRQLEARALDRLRDAMLRRMPDHLPALAAG